MLLTLLARLGTRCAAPELGVDLVDQQQPELDRPLECLVLDRLRRVGALV